MHSRYICSYMARLIKAAAWVLLAGAGAVAAGAVATGEFVAGVVAAGVVAAGVDGAVVLGVVAAGVLLVAVVVPPAVLVVVEPLPFVATDVLLSSPPPPQAPRTAEMARARASLLPDTS